MLTFDVVKRNSKEEEVGEEEAGELVGRARRKLSKNGVKSGQTDQKEFWNAINIIKQKGLQQQQRRDN